MAKALRKAEAALKARTAAYEGTRKRSEKNSQHSNKPGSMNPRKG